jgi:hypothetical protein
MREIGGAVGIAAVSTVLASEGLAAAAADTGAQQAGFDAFQSAFLLMAVVALVGAVTAAVAFPRSGLPEQVPSEAANDPAHALEAHVLRPSPLPAPEVTTNDR